MHQSGHSRAHSMQTVQFSSVRAMTPRLRGGSCGAASGYCAVTARLVSRRDPSDDAPAPSGSLVPHRVEERVDGTRATGRPIDEQVVQMSTDAAVEPADERA